MLEERGADQTAARGDPLDGVEFGVERGHAPGVGVASLQFGEGLACVGIAADSASARAWAIAR